MRKANTNCNYLNRGMKYKLKLINQLLKDNFLVCKRNWIKRMMNMNNSS